MENFPWPRQKGHGKRQVRDVKCKQDSVTHSPPPHPPPPLNQGLIRADLTGWEVWEEPCLGHQGKATPTPQTKDRSKRPGWTNGQASSMEIRATGRGEQVRPGQGPFVSTRNCGV